MERRSSLIRLDPNKVFGQAASHPDLGAEVLRVHSPADSPQELCRVCLEACCEILGHQGCMNSP